LLAKEAVQAFNVFKKNKFGHPLPALSRCCLCALLR
jgi:hypothetical protein